MPNEDVVVEEVEESAEKPTGTDQTKTEKTFTQTDVNKIVAKEKAQWKKSADSATSTLDESITTLRKDVADRDEIIQMSVDLLKKDFDIDEDFAELLDGMDVLAQYRWLVKKAGKVEKKDIPRTPHGEGERTSSTGFTRRNSV